MKYKDDVYKQRLDRGDHAGAAEIVASMKKLSDEYKIGGIVSRGVDKVVAKLDVGIQVGSKSTPQIPRHYSSDEMKKTVFKDFPDQ